MIQKYNIKLKHSKFNQGISAWETQFHDEEVYEEEETKNFVREFKNNAKKDLTENSKVFFHKSSLYPRKKFKDVYPTCRIVRKIEDADFVILDICNVANTHDLYFFDCFKIGDNEHWERIYYNTVLPHNIVKKSFAMCKNYKEEYLFDKKMIEMEALSKKNYVDVNKLKIPGTNDFDLDSRNTISAMFESRSPDMINLAMRMMTGFDYEKNKNKIGLFFCEHFHSWRRMYKKKISVEIKTLLKKLDTDFYGYRRANNKVLINKIKNDLEREQAICKTSNDNKGQQQ